MNKLYDFIEWHNNTTPAINETNLNAMSQAIDDIDDRVIDVAGTIIDKGDAIIQCSENPPYIGDNGNWYTWDTNTGAYVDSGIDASITITIGTVSTLPAGSDATVTNSGTATDPIFNFGLPQGAKGDAPTTKYAQTLSAGSTSVTFTGVTTTANSIVAVATDVSGLEYNSISNSGTSYTVTFDAQASDVEVYLLVTEVA